MLYLPTVTEHHSQIFFTFATCVKELAGACSFPIARTSLIEDGVVLSTGIYYDVSVEIPMHSRKNLESIGAVQVVFEWFDRENQKLSEIRRTIFPQSSSTLSYRVATGLLVMTAQLDILGSFLYHWPLTSFLLLFSLLFSWFMSIIIAYWSFHCVCSLMKMKRLSALNISNVADLPHVESSCAPAEKILKESGDGNNTEYLRNSIISGTSTSNFNSTLVSTNCSIFIDPPQEPQEKDQKVAIADNVANENRLVSHESSFCIGDQFGSNSPSSSTECFLDASMMTFFQDDNLNGDAIYYDQFPALLNDDTCLRHRHVHNISDKIP
uniref:Seipin n=1 Tax=Syphacia muris TaxID=451379 RepID=A0A0N5AQK6_9BILA